MKYYVLNGFGARYPTRWVDDWPFIEDGNFGIGQKIDPTVELPDPLEFPLKRLNPDASDHGPDLPEYFDGTIPLFRDDLIAALEEAGVDNIDYYNAAVTDPDNGQTYTNYKAANIIGCVAAADMDKSEATVHANGPIIDVDFDKLVIDPGRTHGILIFRLAESTNTILVHERLKDYLIKKGFTKLEFLDPGKVAT